MSLLAINFPKPSLWKIWWENPNYICGVQIIFLICARFMLKFPRSVRLWL
jgi:hypothetical protein